MKELLDGKGDLRFTIAIAAINDPNGLEIVMKIMGQVIPEKEAYIMIYMLDLIEDAGKGKLIRDEKTRVKALFSSWKQIYLLYIGFPFQQRSYKVILMSYY